MGHRRTAMFFLSCAVYRARSNHYMMVYEIKIFSKLASKIFMFMRFYHTIINIGK